MQYMGRLFIGCLSKTLQREICRYEDTLYLKLPQNE